jgi:uncharacterized membrane protein YqgA involved in biofilm formation
MNKNIGITSLIYGLVVGSFMNIGVRMNVINKSNTTNTAINEPRVAFVAVLLYLNGVHKSVVKVSNVFA